MQKLRGLGDEETLGIAYIQVLEELKKVVSLKYAPGHDPLHRIRIKLKAIAELLTLMAAIQPRQELKNLLYEIKTLNQMIIMIF